MNRLLIVTAIALLACPSIVWAQSSTTDSASQTPGSWINAARARHQGYQQARLGNARAGKFAGTTEGLDGTSGDFTSSSGGLASLLDLASNFSGSLGGGSSSLGDLLALAGGSSGSSSTGSSTPSSSSGGTTLADLIRMRDDFAAGQSKPITEPITDKTSDRAQVQYETRDGSGAVGRLPKIDSVSQTITPERKFVDRLAEQMATTVFSALAIGFQSGDFIDLLKNQLRPVFFPVTTSDSSGDSSGSSGGTSDGGGIEEQPPPADGGGDSGSIV